MDVIQADAQNLLVVVAPQQIQFFFKVTALFQQAGQLPLHIGLCFFSGNPGTLRHAFQQFRMINQDF